MKRPLISTVALLALLAGVWPASADVFMLSNGGRLEGELLNPDEKPRQAYIIKLAKGGQVTLPAAQVTQVLAAKQELTEYEKVRPQYPDTVAGQWELAEWCREQKLEAQRKIHLQRVIALDTDHALARRALGYSQIAGQWKTRDQAMRDRGYVLYKGEWKLPQQVELDETRRKQELAEKEWFKKIDMWRSWLGRDKDKKGRENITAIDDPMAVKALATRMKIKHEQRADVRLLYVEALGRINSPQAAMTLAVYAIDDPNEEVRLSCLDCLQKKPNKQVVEYFISRLRDKDNATVNYAGVALSRMKDPMAVGPLIEALVTVHKTTIDPGSGAMSFGFSPQGGMGFGAGGKAPKVAVYERNNQAVLDALVTITGQNFTFNERAWKTWHANQKKAGVVDARRG